MVEFALDDDDRGRLVLTRYTASLTSSGSNGSSDNEQDELMEDAEDMEVDADPDPDGDGDGDDDDNDEDNGDEDEDGGEDEEDSPEKPVSQIRRPSLPTTNNSSDDTPTLSQVNGAGPTSHPRPTLTRTSASPRQPSAPLQSPKMRFEVHI
jgi:transcriptional activator SPT8